MNPRLKKFTLVNFFILLKWILFFGLFYCSLIFTWDVVKKYNSKETLFIQNEGKNALLPVITICFSETGINWKYQPNFNITYWNNADKSINFNLQPIYTSMWGICYQLNTGNYESTQNQLHQIKIKTLREVFPTMEFYFTSEKNSYGITYYDWRDGEIFKINLKEKNYKAVDFNVENRNYLKSVSLCNEQSFYECLESKISLADFSNCSTNQNSKLFDKICIPTSLPNKNEMNYPICTVAIQDLGCADYENEICVQYNCSATIVNNVIYNTSNYQNSCPKSCETLQYSGNVVFDKKDFTTNEGEATLEFKFANINVYREHLIFDTIGMIGSVGGTLGLFIGFSFSNILTILIGYLQKFVMHFFPS